MTQKSIPKRRLQKPSSIRLFTSLSTLLILFFTLFFFATQEKKEEKKQETPITHHIKYEFHSLGEGWWSSKALIYFNIPSEIRFFLPDKNENEVKIFMDLGWAEFERIGNMFNSFKEDSDISLLNKNQEKSKVTLSEDLFKVIQSSLNLWEESEGAFDATLWPLKQLWKKAEKEQKYPQEEALKEALQKMGMQHLHLSQEEDSTVIFNNPSLQFDFGGNIKGYAVDKVSSILQEKGVFALLVQCGGEIQTFGVNKNSQPWKIGIQHPKDMEKIFGFVSSNLGMRVSTSGNYRQAIRIGDKEYYHIFNPKTGLPVEEKILGVTLAAFEGEVENITLDSLATASVVLGVEKALALAQKFGVEALILQENDQKEIISHTTPKMQKYLQILE